MIRKSANFVSSITDERGEELLYAGMPITSVFRENIGIGGVISLLWFQRRYVVFVVFISLTNSFTTSHFIYIGTCVMNHVYCQYGKNVFVTKIIIVKTLHMCTQTFILIKIWFH